MSVNENDKIREVQKMRDSIPKLENYLKTNYYHSLLRKWFWPLLGILGGTVLGLLFAYYLPLPELQKTVYFNNSTTLELSRDLFGPYITIQTLLIGFTPVITFFFYDQLKEMQKQNIKEFESSNVKYSDKEHLKIAHYYYNLSNKVWLNIINGLLNYVKKYIYFNLIVLVVIFITYLFLSAGLFIIVSLYLLIISLYGLYPIVSVSFTTS